MRQRLTILIYDVDILNGVVHGTLEYEFKVVLYFCSRVKKSDYVV